MNRFTEYTVDSGRRTSCRLAGSPTSVPCGVNATTEGSKARPSRSGITRGSPVFSSTYATRLFVVPRSMPMMRDMSLLTLPEGDGQVVDDRAQVRAAPQRLLQRLQLPAAVVAGGRVPGRAQRLRDLSLFL